MDRKRRLAGFAFTLTLIAGGSQAAGVYQWRDANGRVHFGDAPAGENATDLTAQYDFRLPFEIRFDLINYRVPPPVRDRLSTSVSKIFTIYNQALDIQYPQESEFLIRIYGSEQAYRAYQRRVAPVLENAAGFYDSSTNRITTWGMDERALQRLVTHECSHAISASGGRRIPVWLNEGLAVYFESMHVSGLSATVPLSDYWLGVLRQRGYNRQLPDLRRTLDSEHNQWYAANGHDNLSYATSWSLVWFLMDSEAGRDILRQLLHPPKRGSVPASSDVIARHWPGGLDGFSQDWQHWLRNARDAAHRY